MATHDENDDWFACPVCGEVVDANALACPACGADEETGWGSDEDDYDYAGADLPDEAYGDSPHKRRGESKAWVGFTAVTLVVIIVLLVLMGIW